VISNEPELAKHCATRTVTVTWFGVTLHEFDAASRTSCSSSRRALLDAPLSRGRATSSAHQDARRALFALLSASSLLASYSTRSFLEAGTAGGHAVWMLTGIRSR